MMILKNLQKLALTTAAVATLGTASTFAVMYDQNVTPGVIMGSGIGSGSWAVDSQNNVELGLRAKVRHDLTTGGPENTYNSDGLGTYTFDKGVPSGQSAPTGVWSFEFSINSDLAGLGRHLADLDFILGLDVDPSLAISLITFDPINSLPFFDHSLGTNSTTAADDVISADAVEYASNIGSLNVAQNSWKAAWYIPGYDPTVDGTYDLSLSALDKSTGELLAMTSITVIQGAGGAAVPDTGSTAALLGAAVLGLLGFRRFSKRS